MLNKFKRWFYSSQLGFFAGLMLVFMTFSALYRMFFGGGAEILGGLFAGFISYSYVSAYTKRGSLYRETDLNGDGEEQGVEKSLKRTQSE